ncbi:DUF2799 domain-containing protein [Amphritea sp. 1_MG-2023]|uniref:DUF2799 domain-containing protein n=1 Tax=Amphritea sp. 1_MG-2023 TaxID=3062670 RepID=UPI0026E453F1|nr:DUF2799 domain-containing protein [Amphritea sp. 1_MG-2023]MDO6564814.1 DUF2799 domain-containing protein [Amphritea sp. 1_MG-2023]
MIKRSLVVLLSIGLVSCATLDQEGCLTADWQLIGFNDGVAGRAAKRLEQHRDACAEYGVVPQIEAYLQGHDRGVIRYCTAMNGYAVARSGASFNAVCRGDRRSAFAQGFRLGSEAYQQIERIAEIKREISDLQAQQREDKRLLHNQREQLMAQHLTQDQRSFLRHEIRQLEMNIRLRTVATRQLEQIHNVEARYLMTLETDLRSQL